MLDITRRKGFSFITVNTLIAELAKMPQEAIVTCCGDANVWLHVEEDEKHLCIDNEDLEECYEDTPPAFDMSRRKAFSFISVNALLTELAKMPQEAIVTCCGDANVWLHVGEDEKHLCIDSEDLDESYHEACEDSDIPLREKAESEVIDRIESEMVKPDESEQKKTNGMIRVEDRLPENKEDVLVAAFWHERWQTMIGWYCAEEKVWRILTPQGEKVTGAVTGWMPLPDPRV